MKKPQIAVLRLVSGVCFMYLFYCLLPYDENIFIYYFSLSFFLLLFKHAAVKHIIQKNSSFCKKKKKTFFYTFIFIEHSIGVFRT